MSPAQTRILSQLAAPAFAVWLLSGPVAADEPSIDRAENVRLTAAQLEKWHLTHRPLDDELSSEWLAEFIRRLDPRRMYFLQSDVDDFNEYSDRLDDLTKLRNYEFPELVQGRFRLRTSHMQNVVEELLAGEFDFSVQEEMLREFSDYAVDTDSFHERWRQRIKLELLIEKLHGRDFDEVKDQLRGRYTRIAAQAREMSDERLYTYYMSALAGRYDADTMFMSDFLLSMFEQTVTISEYSFGLRMEEQDGRKIIRTVYPPLVDHAGDSNLLGWELLAIGGADGELHDVVELHPEDLTHLILSPFGPLSADTSVTLELLNPVTNERRSLSWFRYRTFPRTG
jgi:carboxyl-terminal processing protease